MDIDDIDVEYCTADEVVRRRATSSVAWLPHDDRRATWKVRQGKANQNNTVLAPCPTTNLERQTSVSPCTIGQFSPNFVIKLPIDSEIRY